MTRKLTGLDGTKTILVGVVMLLFMCVCIEVKGETICEKYVEEITYVVCPHYKQRADGKPGREILVSYNGGKELRNARLEVVTEFGNETVKITSASIDSMSVLLPPDVGVASDTDVKINLVFGKEKISRIVPVPAMRHWTVYIYPHSHVDIGYTNTHENVELIHKRNLEVGIQLAKETENYPEGARFVWNPEVTWPVERYMRSESPEKQKELIDAIKKGYIRIDAGYVSTNTSAAGDEELFELFRYGKKIEKLTGKKVETMVQIDIPGLSWGIVPTLAQLDIPYCLLMYNGGDRVGWAHDMNFRPFWWESPDGEKKVLFLQPGSYAPGAHAKGGKFWPLMAGQTDPDKLLKIVKTDNPRADFIDGYLYSQLPVLEKADYYPYDIFPMTWCMADNTPIDVDLPEAVRSWNEEFAFPRLIICGATDIMKVFDEKYGDKIPVMRGDYTEYWTDGLGSSARHTGMNRVTKERLIQTETLWSMLNPSKPFPRAEIEEAWRNVILGTEHTWAFMDPAKQPIQDDILKVKLGYFEDADRMSQELLETAFSGVTKPGSSTFAVFNTHSWEHGGVVVLSAGQSNKYNSVIDMATGKEVVSQRLSSGELAFIAEGVPAMGYKKYSLQTKKTKHKGTFVKVDNILDNGIVKVTVDPETGDVVSMVYGGEEFVDQKALSALNSYRYLKGSDSSGKASKAVNNRITVKENGPLIATLSVESDAEGCNKLIREVSVIAGQPHVEFNNMVDKIATTNKEGIHFGFAFDIPEPTTKVDIPWGIMELEKDQIKAGNRNWIAFQRWLNIANEEKAVTWCSLDACMFENADLTANVLGGAYKSPQWIRTLTPSGTIYSWALNNHWHTNFPLSQEGEVRFRYRVLPHKNTYDAVTANRFGTEQIQQLLAVPVEDGFEFTTGISIKGDPSVVTSIVKTVDNGKVTVVRLRSVSETDQEVKIECNGRQPRSLVVCKKDEEKEGAVNITDNVIKVPAMGFVTLRADW